MFQLLRENLKSVALTVLPLCSVVIVYFFVQFYLSQIAKQSTHDFYLQNSSILNRGDSYELIYKLGSITPDNQWACIEARKLGVAIFDRKLVADCRAGLFQKVETIKGVGNSDLEVEFTIGLPLKFKIIMALFVLLQGLLAGAFIWIIIGKEKEKMNFAREWQLKMKKVLSQVSHDIKSPLAALRLATNHLPIEASEQKQLLLSVSGRIESIIEDLRSEEGNDGTVKNNSEMPYCFVFPMMQGIVSEKEMIIKRDCPQLEIIFKYENDSDGLGTNSTDQELSRVLSNIINNAIESFDVVESKQGQIHVSLTSKENTIIISIQDNGKGIPPELLKNGIIEGKSFGKPKGKGLGLNHANETVRSIGGTLEITSALKLGTKVVIHLPLVSNPIWLSRNIDLKNKKNIVIIEDDLSVMNAWKVKLKSLPSEIKVLYFDNPNFFDGTEIDFAKTLFIIDHDFANSQRKGLEFIKDYDLSSNAILCTSYFNDTEIQNEIMRLGAKMLPKHMMATAQLEFTSSVGRPSNKMPDLTAVLIDDDRLIHATWTLAANCSNVKLDCYFSFDEFMKHDYPTNTPIFIDKNLKNASGIDVAERITQNLGFSSVYMASGDDLRKEELPSKVCGFVVNKEFPAELISKIKKQSVKFH